MRASICQSNIYQSLEQSLRGGDSGIVLPSHVCIHGNPSPNLCGRKMGRSFIGVPWFPTRSFQEMFQVGRNEFSV